MKNKMYFIILFFILAIPFSVADIDSRTNLKEKYNLDDPIKSSFDVGVDEDFSGLFKLNLFCGNFNIDYFVILIDIKEDENIVVEPPELRPMAMMKGDCKLVASLESLDKEIFEKFDSNEFKVTDKLVIELDISNDLVLPGETVDINGKVSASYDDSESFSGVLAFDGEEQKFALIDGEFNEKLEISDKIASGKHILSLEMRDSFGNSVDKIIDVIVEPRISKISIELNKKSFIPEETIEIKPIVFDQADEGIGDKEVTVKIVKEKDELFSDTVESYEEVTYTFLKYTEPGEVVVKASYNDLKTEEIITIEELKKLDIKLEGELVNIKNDGNVRYDAVLDINLFGEDKNYVLNKRVKLDPEESMVIDLSKEVSTDEYVIKVALDDENISLTDGTLIEDKRSALNKITGAVVEAGDGVLSRKPIIASIIILIIVASIVLFFIRKRKKEV